MDNKNQITRVITPLNTEFRYVSTRKDTLPNGKSRSYVSMVEHRLFTCRNTDGDELVYIEILVPDRKSRTKNLPVDINNSNFSGLAIYHTVSNGFAFFYKYVNGKVAGRISLYDINEKNVYEINGIMSAEIGKLVKYKKRLRTRSDDYVWDIGELPPAEVVAERLCEICKMELSKCVCELICDICGRFGCYEKCINCTLCGKSPADCRCYLGGGDEGGGGNWSGGGGGGGGSWGGGGIRPPTTPDTKDEPKDDCTGSKNGREAVKLLLKINKASRDIYESELQSRVYSFQFLVDSVKKASQYEYAWNIEQFTEHGELRNQLTGLRTDFKENAVKGPSWARNVTKGSGHTHANNTPPSSADVIMTMTNAAIEGSKYDFSMILNINYDHGYVLTVENREDVRNFYEAHKNNFTKDQYGVLKMGSELEAKRTSYTTPNWEDIPDHDKEAYKLAAFLEDNNTGLRLSKLDFSGRNITDPQVTQFRGKSQRDPAGEIIIVYTKCKD